MYKFHYVNKASQLYVLSNGVMLKSYRAAELDSKARAVLEWLKADDNIKQVRAILRANNQDIELLEIPARIATKKHYDACQRVLLLAKNFQEMTLRRFAPGLTPELINSF